MKEYRSVSQVLFGFLPEQTVDLNGRVWKVKDWVTFINRTDIDPQTIRKAIIKQAGPWEKSGKDGGFVSSLRKNTALSIVTLDEENGVRLEPFPNRAWVCRSCFRVHSDIEASCPCGKGQKKSNMYFVGYHNECGAIREPYVPKCKEHKQARVRFPGTSSAAEILFDCPICEKILRKGFGNVACDCGQGNLKFLPHRASSVYTPHSAVVVNPPDKEKIRILSEAGGPPRALSWVINGLVEDNIEKVKSSTESLRRTLKSQGLADEIIEKMLETAGTEGEVPQSENLSLSIECQEEAESQAVTLALATIDSRVQIKHLVEAVAEDNQLKRLYSNDYPASLSKAGLKGVDLIDKFPILTAQFGYTRGGHKPGEDKLTGFKSVNKAGYVIYSDLAQTEALYVQLDPKMVINWLRKNGFNIERGESESHCRKIILSALGNPSESQDEIHDTIEKLIHSYAHRFIRIASVFSGIDRNGLSELLVPYHLGFFIYGAAKGDFVLGGLQAVFETELHRLLNAIVDDDHRCAMDPACQESGAACMGCLHLGEPSCRHFNMKLSRNTLFGKTGYLR
ncbi:hypothetical protein [Idiomarina abyssalis]|uniref:hypothetical protein n=1 Tax=Idiomarina abyssalis TaxID=86102 RepID=UPI003A919470